MEFTHDGRVSKAVNCVLNSVPFYPIHSDSAIKIVAEKAVLV